MPLLETLTGGAKVLGALGGIFGGKKKERSPSWNIRSQAEGAREAAREQGFNPLTMLQYGNPGGSMSSGGGEPPLASIDLLVGGLSDLGSVWSGEAAQKSAADRLSLDLARLKLDQARSGVVAAAPAGASASVGGSASVLGKRPAAHLTYGGQQAEPFTFAAMDDFGLRERMVAPTENMPGYFEVQNKATEALGLDGIKVPGSDGDAADITQWPTYAAAGLGAVLTQWPVKGARAVGNYFYPGKFDTFGWSDVVSPETWAKGFAETNKPDAKQKEREGWDYLQPNYWAK